MAGGRHSSIGRPGQYQHHSISNTVNRAPSRRKSWQMADAAARSVVLGMPELCEEILRHLLLDALASVLRVHSAFCAAARARVAIVWPALRPLLAPPFSLREGELLSCTALELSHNSLDRCKIFYWARREVAAARWWRALGADGNATDRYR